MDANRKAPAAKAGVNIIRPFILANMGLFVIVAVIWLHPAITSWLSAREIIARQRQIYAAYQAQAHEYHELQTVGPYQILPYAYLAIVMDQVQSLAGRYGLESTQFASSEPVSYPINGERFVEIRAIATFTGQEHEATQFTYSLADTAVFIRNLNMEFLDDTVVNLRVEFSLFGRGE